MYKILFLFIIIIFLSCTSEPPTIGIQPYGKIDNNVLDSIKGILKRTYNMNLTILKHRELPKEAFVNIKSARYRADSLLIDLSKNRPDSIDFVMGVTAKDISITKRDSDGNIKTPESKYIDWGIFGLGYKPGRSCVISTYRLQSNKRELYLSRVQKISVHEIGHNMGLDHCETEKCVMQDAVESINTVDSENYELCKRCYNKI